MYRNYMSFYNKGKDVGLLAGYIKKHFTYNPTDGTITRMDRKNSNGSLDKDGYLIIKIKTKQFKAHRIAWFLYYGEMPDKEIDHINRIRTDNRIENLRLADRKSNVLNIQHKPNKDTGVVGVYKDKTTKGLKKIFTTRFKNKTFRFHTIEEAIQFRKSYERKL